jgi:endoglucanase
MAERCHLETRGLRGKSPVVPFDDIRRAGRKLHWPRQKRIVMSKNILLCLFAGLLAAQAADQLSRVSVKGNQFVTGDGKPIVFRGLDTSDPDKLERNEQWNKAYFAAAKSWGANVVRFPVHPAAWHIRGQDNYLKLLDQGVGLAREQGLYVIIDWHSMGNLCSELFAPGYSELYPPTLYNTTKQETLDFWSTMARHYAGNNTVAFFELFNEPALGGKMGECTWAQWKELMEQVIATIRANGGTAIPLVAGFNYGYDLTPVANAPIKAGGIGYVSHPYPMKRKAPWEEQWTKDWGFVADKYPVFATEVGFCSADDKKAHIPVIGDESYGDALTSYCAKKGISYSVWCFDPHWAPPLIEDWTFAPTRQGVYFKRALQRNH